jgi:monooxygenase
VTAIQHVDVLVVGAGLSGIGAACHLKRDCPERSVLIVEARPDLGGTWDLFRYPGVRSDSDMHTLGYSFRPWPDPQAIADGASILRYIRETAAEYGLLDAIRFGHRVVEAHWDSDRAQWTVELLHGTETVLVTCGFLHICSGYYDYASGYTPDFPGIEDFAGTVVHPQQWPRDLDLDGKRVVVIGSGATAITLVPALASRTAHVTMLQRSPGYIVSGPSRDNIAAGLGRLLPDRAALAAVRWKNVLLSTAQYGLCRRAPRLMSALMYRDVVKQLPADFDVDTHLKPDYAPWDQRVCLAPDGDLFRELATGRASIVTDRIDRFTATGIRLVSGRELEADVVVTATGLNLLPLGGIRLNVDGTPVDVGSAIAYRAMMLCGVPNLAWTVGYTNASWTLKADLVAHYLCRLLNHMAARGFSAATPLPPDEPASAPLVDLASGYVARGIARFPKQGAREPWRLRQNYVVDYRVLRRAPLDDHLRFTTRSFRSEPARMTVAAE